ncbi:MAG: hypothetical protein NVS3B17_10980 [Vulcanimicrobiaceae bacterium]
MGLGSGVAYAAIRPHVRAWLPWPVAGVVLGLATLVASEGSATALGATDWRTWSASEWFADIVPRTIYGLTTAWVVEQGSPSDVAPIVGTAATLVREETKVLEPV